MADRDDVTSQRKRRRLIDDDPADRARVEAYERRTTPSRLPRVFSPSLLRLESLAEAAQSLRSRFRPLRLHLRRSRQLVGREQRQRRVRGEEEEDSLRRCERPTQVAPRFYDPPCDMGPLRSARRTGQRQGIRVRKEVYDVYRRCPLPLSNLDLPSNEPKRRHQHSNA